MVAGNADPKKEGRHMRKVDLQSQVVADGVFSDLVFSGADTILDFSTRLDVAY